MIVLGLTGSIGMGKSTTAKIFAELGAPYHDSDETVHHLMGPSGAAVGLIAAYFKSARVGDAINRKELSKIVMNDDKALKTLENILHPLVRQDADLFLEKARRAGAKIAVLDIPLLFETGRHKDVDYTVVVTAPENQQRQRVMSRKGMTEEKFEKLKSRQMPDVEKQQLADFIVPTGLGKAYTRKVVQKIIDELLI